MSEAKKTLDLLVEGKTPKILSLIPEGQSPKLYLDLIKTQVMGVDSKGNQRPDEDLLLFLYVAKRTGLDPLTKQIYAIYRWDSRIGREKMTIQSSIDGMRLVAQRTKQYAGQDDVIYDSEELKSPKKASVTVYKMIESQKVAFTASARWAEYVQTDKNGMPSNLWAKMPYLMLGKCAEALSLRKAFPNELSGIYSEEEMAQSSNILADVPKPDRSKKIVVVSGAPDDSQTGLNQDPTTNSNNSVGTGVSNHGGNDTGNTGDMGGSGENVVQPISNVSSPPIVVKPNFASIQSDLKKQNEKKEL